MMKTPAIAAPLRKAGRPEEEEDEEEADEEGDDETEVEAEKEEEEQDAGNAADSNSGRKHLS